MDPKSRQFVGITKYYFKLVPFFQSSILKDVVPEDQSQDAVSVQIENYIDPFNSWRNDLSAKHFITFNKDGTYNQKWKTEFLDKNLVVIKAETDKNKCMTYLKDKEMFDLLPCTPDNNYSDQKFAITNYMGLWDSDYDRFSQRPKNGGGWGKCVFCLPNGFGAEEFSLKNLMF